MGNKRMQKLKAALWRNSHVINMGWLYNIGA
jgi:hypothetical protein